jgi:WD40 repeat protein
VVTVADRTLRVRSRVDGQLIKEGVVAPDKITAIAGTPDGQHVVVGSQGGSLQRVNAAALSQAGPRIQLANTVTALVAGKANAVVALLDDKTFVVVDLASGEELSRGDLTMKASAAAVSPDFDLLAVGGSAGEVGLLDLATAGWVAAPQVGHQQAVGAVAFSTDGQTFVTSSFDAGVRLWNGSTGEPIAGVQVGQDPSAAFATMPAAGTDAIVATRDGAVYRLDTRFDQWKAFACAVAARNLTPEEWQAVFADQPYRETCPG